MHKRLLSYEIIKLIQNEAEKMKIIMIFKAVTLVFLFTSLCTNTWAKDPFDDALQLVTQIRQVAQIIPGALPTRINFTKVAESHRTYADIIEGGSYQRFVSARSAFQIVFADGTIMLDSGMDEEVHRYYGFGRDEPYWQEKNDEVQLALKQAKQILITHEHGDHIAGVIRSDEQASLAAKTLLTQDQVNTLINSPQLPQIALTEEKAKDYIVVEYESYLPVAPGVVLIKSPGHTKGHQMIYVRLDDQKEYLFIGDIGWSLDNVTEQKLRPGQTMARIKEDPQALRKQLAVIKQLMDDEGLIIVPSHDDVLLQRYATEGKLGSSLNYK